MSAIPPSEDAAQTDRASDGVALDVTSARGAVRTGRNIWILVISLGLAVVLVLGYWLIRAPSFHAVNNARAVRIRSVSGYPVQGASARPSPGPAQAPAAGNYQ
jgi:hypothetical protein